jgi:hypothetical protein
MLEILDLQEMNEIKGGVSRSEYCHTLLNILLNNDLSEGAKEGARVGAERAGC